jgi:ABC-2 type transport system permease protein
MLMSSGYMMHAVVEEKENRTMEVLITSVSSSQLIAGKVVGILAIALTQLLSWTIFGILMIVIAGRGLGIEWFQEVKIEWMGIFLIVLLAIPTFITASGLMVAIGSTVAETQEAQWVVSIFMLLFWAPLWMIGIIGDNPNAPLSVVLSLLPFTSLMTISIRNMFVAVPYWQIGLSVSVQIICALIAVWFAGRAFRLGMLWYGQKMSFRELFRKPASVSE